MHHGRRSSQPASGAAATKPRNSPRSMPSTGPGSATNGPDAGPGANGTHAAAHTSPAGNGLDIDLGAGADGDGIPSLPISPLGKDYSCGLFSLRPHWLQRFANKQSFLTIFCATSILQGMYYTYFVSVLTTIEKLYQIQSKTTGIIMSATEIGQIGGALLLTYYGGQGHRPRWIAAGMLVFALASVLCSTPHYLFGGNSPAASSYSSPLAFSPGHQNSSNSEPLRDFSTKLCSRFNASSLPPTAIAFLQGKEHLERSPSGGNYLADTLALKSDDGETTTAAPSKCDDPDLPTTQSKVTQTVLTIFFTSLFLIGIGSTAVNTLGIPYIDDNVAPRESPLYFG